ncbi:2-dehydropantoate 2-reductase [Alteromonas ponticola]|uniref:2-dehydropantoate 2-reductase n=1 Tax=Alteromonas ponticola TaxID=2720613 RepID=A0ABX1R0X0_9ALTE|nr:2-dehydropantoate 2-reductase [Alteromonas ponticola]
MPAIKHFNFAQVIGDGAIGSLICAGMETAQLPYGRKTRSTMPVTTLETYHNKPIQLASDRGNCQRLTADDLLVLPIKVHQLNTALDECESALHPNTTVMLLQNGMGGEEIVSQRLPQQPLVIATTSHGAYKDNNRVKHTGLGETKIGSNNIDAGHWKATAALQLLNLCIGPARWESNMTHALWSKLAVNAVINPLTALNDIPNGELTQNKYRNEIELLCTEIASVMHSQNIHVSTRELVDNCLNVAAATAKNFSSMHQDVAHKRKTEIDAINGFIVSTAQKKGIDVPINALLVQKIKAR